MINIASCVRDSLFDKYMLLTHFYLMQGKIEAWFVSLVSREFHEIDKKELHTGKMNCYTWFFTGVAIKIAISVNWRTTSEFLW